MLTGETILWGLIALVGLCASALCSGLETGAYSVNRLRLHVLAHRGDRRAVLLRSLVMRPTTVIGTLLIGNNIANYMGTAGITMIVETFDLADWQVVVLNAAVVTPILFVFGETLPKDLFSTYSDRWMYRFAKPLHMMSRVFTWTGLLPLIESFSHGVAALLRLPRSTAVFHPRRQVELLLREGAGVGLLSDEQSAIVKHILTLGDRRVSSEMIPWDKVHKVRVTDPPDVLWDLAGRSTHLRYPVVDAHDQIAGVVHIYDALMHERASCPPIAELMGLPTTLDAALPLREALSLLQERHMPMAVVVRDLKVVGIVTVKDLVEPITGELSRW